MVDKADRMEMIRELSMRDVGSESNYGGFSPESRRAMIDGGSLRREAALDL